MFNTIARFTILLSLLFMGAASAQEPPYDHPGAQQVAEMMHELSIIGLMPAPTGWFCLFHLPDIFSAIESHCQPDPALAAQQERDRQRWLEAMRDRALEMQRRRRRR